MPNWLEAKFAATKKSISDTPKIACVKLSARRQDGPTENPRTKSPQRAHYRLQYMRSDAVGRLLSLHVAEQPQMGPHSPATQRLTQGNRRTCSLDLPTPRDGEACASPAIPSNGASDPGAALADPPGHPAGTEDGTGSEGQRKLRPPAPIPTPTDFPNTRSPLGCRDYSADSFAVRDAGAAIAGTRPRRPRGRPARPGGFCSPPSPGGYRKQCTVRKTAL